jgi:hypothetical protein
MMRVVRAVWVSASNLLFVGIIVRHLMDIRSLHQLLRTPMEWREYWLLFVIIAILLLGVGLEVLGTKLASFVNVGFYLLALGDASVPLINASAEPEARLLGLTIAVPSAVVLLADLALYSQPMWAKRFGK